jgi:hypothetical protein
MTWTYLNKPITELPVDVIGFVYIITHTTTGKRYIGKKLAKFKRTRTKMITQKNLKRVKRKVVSYVDSDWLSYWGSCQQLSADIAILGENKFTREIIRLCYSKAECSYWEAKEQFYNGVLESDEWYNGQISVRIHKSHIVAKKPQTGTAKIPLDTKPI